MLLDDRNYCRIFGMYATGGIAEKSDPTCDGVATTKASGSKEMMLVAGVKAAEVLSLSK